MVKSLERYKFFNQIRALSFVNSIVLYGSRVRGDNKDRSDIDIAIDCVGATEADWLKIVDILENADTLLKIDAVRLDTLSPNSPLKKSIEKEGIIIYRKLP